MPDDLSRTPASAARPPQRLDRIARRLKRVEGAQAQANADRARLREGLDGATARVARALARLDGLAPRGQDALDPARVLSETLGRATRRIGGLSEELREAGRANEAKAAQIAHLQDQLRELRVERAGLEEKLATLSREKTALARDARQSAAALTALAASRNRAKNNAFWSLAPFFADLADFAAYAERVLYAPRRLYAMLMRADIEADASLSPELRAAASKIADLFDPIFYLAEHSDVALAGTNPLLHYLTDGAREGRRPHPLFDPEYYRAQKPLAPENALLDYVEAGSAAGLSPHPLFDPQFYRARYPDVAESGAEPLHHYEVWGGREGRDPSPIFDTEYYLARRGAAFSGEIALIDYLGEGWLAGVDPHPLFSARDFAAAAGIAEFAEAPLAVYRKHPELWASAKPHPLFDPLYFAAELARHGLEPRPDLSPLGRFCAFGPEADLSPHILFDAPLYRYQVEHEQGRKLEEPALLDYLKRGWHDKSLLPNLLFDPATYAEAQGETEIPELLHYLLAGDKEGARTHAMFDAGFYNAQRTDGGPATALEHFWAEAGDPAIPSHPHAGRPLSREPIDWVRSVIDVQGNFDPDFYRLSYPDLGTMSNVDAVAHYLQFGKGEGRFGAAREVLNASERKIRDVPLGFFFDEYLEYSPDLETIGTGFHPLIRHYLPYGAAENRTIGRWQFHLDTLALDFPTPSAPIALQHELKRVDVCLLIHVFYADLWPELAAFAKNFEGVSKDVFVNVVDAAWTPRFQRELRELCPGAFVQLSNDDGRDIGGFMRLLDNVDLGRYEAFAFMHTKKSPHIPEREGEYWRRSLMTAFAGSPEIVRRNIALFREDQGVGLIGSKEWRSTEIGKNVEVYERLLDMFEIPPEHRGLEYLSGTMFMMRPAIVRRLYEVLRETKWEYGGDQPLEYHMDGQLAHGVERLVGNLVRQMGYRFVWA
ncbi:MAG TPA: rhamnan synthesis F family protein [Stellaceae bacterium]|nr:rhamnan synthesis F family protein [Stellaceae bacterium]